MNRIWGTTSRAFLQGEALTIGMVGIVGFMLAFSVMLTSILVALRRDDGSVVAASDRELSAAYIGR